MTELMPQQHRLYVEFVFFTGVKNGWKFAWQTMMKELAPQTADGSYSRPSYDFQAKIGDANFPVSSHNQKWITVLSCTQGPNPTAV